MKKLLFIITLIATIGTAIAGQGYVVSEVIGDGTEQNPYRIKAIDDHPGTYNDIVITDNNGLGVARVKIDDSLDNTVKTDNRHVFMLNSDASANASDVGKLNAFMQIRGGGMSQEKRKWSQKAKRRDMMENIYKEFRKGKKNVRAPSEQ